MSRRGTLVMPPLLGVAEGVCRYIYFLTAMKKTEESLRKLKRGRTSAFTLFGSAATREDDSRADEEKIRTQMILDVEAFGKDAKSLGVSVEKSSTYRTLRDLAHAPLTEASETR
jgi:conserved oligomeric Golgi complex subunit 2